MKTSRLAALALLAAVAGAAQAGGNSVGFITTPTVISAASIFESLAGQSVAPGLQSNQPNIFERVSTLASAVVSADGQTVTVPVLLSNGDVISVTLDKSGKVVKVEG